MAGIWGWNGQTSSATAGRKATHRDICLVCGASVRRFEDVPPVAAECASCRGYLSVAVRQLIREGVLPDMPMPERIAARTDPRTIERARQMRQAA